MTTGGEALANPTQPQPLPLWPSGDNYPRRGLWRGSALPPGVHMSTSARLRPWLARRQDQPREILLSVLQAAAGALELHPRLNFFNCWGRLVWAGEPVRAAAVLENPDLTCDLVVTAQPHRMTRDQLRQALEQGRGRAPSGPGARLREAFPGAAYALERLGWAPQRRRLQERAPLFVSMLGLPGIDFLAYTPTLSMALYPGWPRDGRLPLTLCFSHQLGNARPVGRFLLTVKELLE